MREGGTGKLGRGLTWRYLTDNALLFLFEIKLARNVLANNCGFLKRSFYFW